MESWSNAWTMFWNQSFLGFRRNTKMCFLSCFLLQHLDQRQSNSSRLWQFAIQWSLGITAAAAKGKTVLTLLDAWLRSQNMTQDSLHQNRTKKSCENCGVISRNCGVISRNCGVFSRTGFFLSIFDWALMALHTGTPQMHTNAAILERFLASVCWDEFWDPTPRVSNS